MIATSPLHQDPWMLVRKIRLTENHDIGRLERQHTLIHQTGPGIGECRNSLEKPKPRSRDVLMLRIEDVVVPTLSGGVRGNDGKCRKLDYDKVLGVSKRPTARDIDLE